MIQYAIGMPEMQDSLVKGQDFTLPGKRAILTLIMKTDTMYGGMTERHT